MYFPTLRCVVPQARFHRRCWRAFRCRSNNPDISSRQSFSLFICSAQYDAQPRDRCGSPRPSRGLVEFNASLRSASALALLRKPHTAPATVAERDPSCATRAYVNTVRYFSLTLTCHGRIRSALPLKAPNAALPQILDKVGSKASEAGTTCMPN